MSQIHIFGLNHFHQWIEPRCWTSAGKTDEQRQKYGLRTTLEQIVAQNEIASIAEEAHPDRQCLGRVLAREKNLGYCDITMPISEREKRGIRTPGYDQRTDTRESAYRLFEEFMFEHTTALGSRASRMRSR